MGNVVGAVKGQVLRKARRFNVENRTERFLEKKVKVAPPKPLATQREIELINQESPDLMNEITKPNPELLGRLKDVYVSSSDPLPEISRKVDPSKPLPSERKSTHLEYNYVEPETKSPGFLSLREALQLLSQYQRDKKNNPASKLATEYNLKEEDVENMVEYFKLYTLVDSGQKSLGEANVSSYLVGDESEQSKNMPMNVLTGPEFLKKMGEWERGKPLLPKEEKDTKDNKSEEKK